MDADRFDLLARAFANATSRRSLIRTLGSLGLGKLSLRAGGRASAAESLCADEVPCTLCQFDAKAGTLDCSAPCPKSSPALDLCELAVEDPGTIAIRRHLSQLGYTQTPGLEIAVIRTGGADTMSMMAQSFSHNGTDNKTAILSVIKGPVGGPLVNALLKDDSEVVGAMSVDSSGHVLIQDTPRRIPSEATPVASTGLLASSILIQVPPNPCDCSWCDFLCGNFAAAVPCAVAGVVVCAPSANGGIKAEITCALIFEVFCNLAGYFSCEAFCSLNGCANCDPGCSTRDPEDCGQCIDQCLNANPGTVCCEGQCVDEVLLDEDANNCGACGNQCPGTCCSGACCPDSPFLGCCDGECTPIVTADHCGGCDACPPGQRCRDSRLDGRGFICAPCTGDGHCSACETCNETTGECESTCGPCETCNRVTGVCSANCKGGAECDPTSNECVTPPPDDAAPEATEPVICENGGVECPGWVYGCCEPGQHCCEEFGSCCDEGCICCGLIWCCCGGLQCSEYIAGCE